MAKRTKWTVEEDEILVQAINANPHNKAKKPSREVSEKIGRSAKCCSNRWYQALSNPEHKSYVGCMFTMVGVSSRLDNKTVNREKVHITPTKTKRGLWTKDKGFTWPVIWILLQ